jgi:trans-aconitate 2-methyltransferase
LSARTWDPKTYDRVSDVQVAWAKGVLERLPLRGDETVLDAGCGSGRVTALLLERLPRGRVIGVDADEGMVAHARDALGDRADVIVSDLTELELDAPVDAIFSNAVFHWVPDHALLFERLFAALSPGGRLVAQCGGEGNIEDFLAVVDEVAATAAFAPYLEDFRRTWEFPSPGETEARLRDAGFEPVRAWLEPSDVTPDEPAAFLSTVVLGVHLPLLPEDLREPFVEEILARTGTPPRLRYVRLNIDARRPS